MIGYIDHCTDDVLDLEIKFLSGHEIRTMQKTQYITTMSLMGEIQPN